MTEQEIEQSLIEKLVELKYTYRPDIRDRAALETNFRQHFEALNRVHLTDTEFARLLESIVTPDVFAAAKHLREKNSFERDDLITAQTQKLATLKTHKKGLMQQLFPDTATTPPLRGTPPEEGNGRQNSPPVEGWTAKLDGVVK